MVVHLYMRGYQHVSLHEHVVFLILGLMQAVFLI